MKAFLAISLIMAITIGAIAVAQDKSAQMPNIEGSWVLQHRTLPDGSVVKPPQIVGLMTFVDGYRNFNLIEKGPEGKYFSIGSVSKYELTAKEYKETNLCYTHNDQIHDMGTMFDVSGKSGASPIAMTDGKVSFQMPNFGEPAVEFSGGTLTATREGAFVDTWTKLE